MEAISQEVKSAIIEALKEEIEVTEEQWPEYEEGLKRAIFVVEKSFPTSDSCNQSACATWIPVTERLPDKGFVIGNVSTRYGDVSMEVDYRGDKRFYNHSDCVLDVTHWQPLPTPPVTK